MKIIAFNGSPRKEWNTEILLQQALKGAAATGAQTELIHLYDLRYRGCYSCFACKEKNGKSYGSCPIDDDLLSIFKKIENADAVIFGSPIYLGSVTGEMHSFLERLVFQYLTYTNPPGSLLQKKISTGFIYTMGLPEEHARKFNYNVLFDNIEWLLALIFGSSERLLVADTYQFKDCAKVLAPRIDGVTKLGYEQEVLSLDCQRAFDLGARLIAKESTP